jgi:hypothetical protein
MYTYIHTGMCIHTYMHTRIYGKEFTVMTSEKGTCTDAASGGENVSFSEIFVN